MASPNRTYPAGRRAIIPGINLDYESLENLRSHHPAWRLLRSEHAALVASFLQKAFVVPNVRVMDAAELAMLLENELYALRRRLGPEEFPRPAPDYLNDWASPEKGWLRKFYRQGTDEPQFDLTPASEKAIAWLSSLDERSFVGTESRLLTLFELLRQMSEGSEADPAKRIEELRKRRDEIDAEIARVEAGDVPLLADTALRDRFQQFNRIARDLLGDFREVEHNFRQLDRRVRERIALWEGRKGHLLEDIMGERDAIADSDEGRSFRAFWDFLMSSRRQDQLTAMLEQILALEPLAQLSPDPRIRRVHYDWLEAGEQTQRSVAQLSQQLRRFLDDRAWLENRRIMDLLRDIEAQALSVRDTPPAGAVMAIAASAATLELPMERPLFNPAANPAIASIELEAGDVDVDAGALFSLVVVDKARIERGIRKALQEAAQVTLRELIERQPLRQGLAELVAYLQLGSDAFKTVVDDGTGEEITWQGIDRSGNAATRKAKLPRLIFVR